ncbi:tetratricopeptide repeat protein [candidate division KSB1 bacterium]|nr:tetratricopeptide repeat protein [candidate division KSB1 bacterium]
MSTLNAKQQKFIAENYRRMSVKQLVEKLKIGPELITAEIQRLTTLSRGKKWLFTTIMLALPLLFFIGGECVLRTLHYGDEINLVLTHELNGTDYCFINKQVARRFFSYHEINIPDARSAVFKKEKSPHTYRIFCLGGSTTAGFPFQYNATFPSLLNDRLTVLFPDKEIEVINVGISAINSYSVRDFTQELVRYQPDLFLIYMGHNEFYGALGIGSTQQFGQNRRWVLGYLQLQKLRWFQLVRNLIGRFRQAISQRQPPSKADQTLMQRVVKDQYIPLNSRHYQIAQDYFEKNLNDIVQMAQAVGAKVILSTLVSNLADQAPFSLQFAAKTSPAQQQLWHAVLDSGYRLEQMGQYNEALEKYFQAEQIDPTPASLYFRRAKCLQMLGQIETAHQQYIRAKDLDGLRFRASSDFNDLIRRVGQRLQTPVIEMETVLAPYARNQILDRQLFTDHLHPNFPGYFWMAKAFCTTMWQHDCIASRDQWRWERDKSTAEYRRLAGVTDLELEIANHRIRQLTSHWPFKQAVRLRENAGDAYSKLLETTVNDLFDRKFGWNEAHYRMARFLTQQQAYDRAAQEYEAVIKVTPYNYFPYLELANLQMRQQDFNAAEATLTKCQTFSRNLPYAAAKLGMLYYFTGRFDQAIQQLQQALTVNQRVKRFQPDELAGAHYLLSLAYSSSGKLDLAKQAAEAALQVRPDYPEAKQVLQKLEKIGPPTP